jgi:hypothetical protein
MQGAIQGTSSKVEQGLVTNGAVNGERRLWLAVIMQAVEEWRNGTLRNRRKAQEFIFDNGRDFDMVCANAGLDASSLRSKLLKIGRAVSAQGSLARPLLA